MNTTADIDFAGPAGRLAVVLFLVAATPTPAAETVGEVVIVNGKACGWIGRSTEKQCGDEEIDFKVRSSIDRGMTVKTEEPADTSLRIGRWPVVCLMKIDQWAVGDEGGVVMMGSDARIIFSEEVLADFKDEMKKRAEVIGLEQFAGAVRIALPPNQHRDLLVKAGRAYIVLHGTYVEIRVDEDGTTTVGVLEGRVSIVGLVSPGTGTPGAPPPPVLPGTPPADARRVRVYAGEQVTVSPDGEISPPVPFPAGGPAADPTISIEDDGPLPRPGIEGPGPIEPFLPQLLCDLPRGVCN